MNNKYFKIQTRLIFVFLLLLTNGCQKKQAENDEGESKSVSATVAVKIDVIHEHDAVLSFTAVGKTDALRKEKLYSPIAGRIITLKVFEGSEVKQGDVVAVIQSKESFSAISGAETMLQSATTEEQKAQAEKALKLAQSSQNIVNVFAKFDGVVSSRGVNQGELVSENSELLTVIDLSSVNFIAEVPTQELHSISIGQQASVQFQSIPNKKFLTTVEAINPQTDAVSQTVKVRLRFLSELQSLQSPLRTDITGTANFVTGIHHHALFVPRTALLRNDENNSYSIVTMTNDSLALSVSVTVGAMNDSTVEIFGKNIHTGMPVIVEGNYALADSTHVIAEPGK
jgi:membrane fusion protein, multidrug efflux system